MFSFCLFAVSNQSDIGFTSPYKQTTFITHEELKKVSGGFRPEDLEYLTEEEKRRWEELSTRAYQLHQGLPNTQQEYDIAFKEMQG